MDELWIGSGATYTVGTDRYPATVVGWNEFKSGAHAGEIREILVQRDSYKAIQYTWPQEYEYTPNPSGATMVFRKNKKGYFVNVGGGSYLHVGERQYYNDPHF